MRTQRIQDIENFILQNRTVTLDEICEQFQISISTLRRDLNEILQNPNIHKIYGGVTTQTQKKELVAFGERNIVNPERKERIARKAAELVVDQDIIFIDSGTTTLYMAEALSQVQDLTVLTNNLAFIQRAMEYDNIKIISLSGTLNRKTYSFTGTHAAKMLQNFNVSKAFMATTGFSIKNGVTNSSPMESDLKKMAVARSQQVYLLADHSKFGSVSLMTYCTLDQINCLVTDDPPTDKLADYLASGGVDVLLA